jgi:hypothetical protein
VFGPGDELIRPGDHLPAQGADSMVRGRSSFGRGDEVGARSRRLPAPSGQLLIQSRDQAPRSRKFSAAMARERPELWHDREKYALNGVSRCFSGLDVAAFSAGREYDEPGLLQWSELVVTRRTARTGKCVTG